MEKVSDNLVVIDTATDSDWFRKYNCGKFWGRRLYFSSTYFNLNPYELHIPANSIVTIHEAKAYRLMQWLLQAFRGCEGFKIDVSRLFGEESLELANGGEINNVLRCRY